MVYKTIQIIEVIQISVYLMALKKLILDRSDLCLNLGENDIRMS